MSSHHSSRSRLIVAAGLFTLVVAGSGSVAASPGTDATPSALTPIAAACANAHARIQGITATTPCRHGIPAANLASGPGTYSYQTIDYPGASQTTFWGINDLDELSGQYSVGSGVAHAMVYRHGRFEPLDPSVLGTYFSASGGPTDLGTTFGGYADETGLQHGFQIQHGQFSTVDFPGHLNSNVDQVNLFGAIAGVYWDADGAFHGVLREGTGHDTPIDVAGARETYPLGINDEGEMVGYWDTNPAQTHGFYRSADGQFSTIDVPGAAATVIFEINDAGQAVGYYIDASGNTHGFIEARGQFQSLDMPGAAATLATAINNLGVIAGEYFDNAGMSHGFVATP
ncbi:hypothetical protein [Dyella mobilis]|uniref:Uncharacterized protein n=1 Tax=Dyella mobilis TaxID=1849582 RepID=A0ABS2KCX4_9GAMM|nr:hypothetical protein [Dyella mobilis]MBM7129031.1 hypothetical protein [Dyella mobilis]GLQ99275.1 hypothetical protein GCM10007863_36950 [Dyella mobilis]